MQQPSSDLITASRGAMSLRSSLLRNAGSSMTAQALIATIMRMTRHALNALGSSILFSEEKTQRLVFVFADGSSAERVQQLKISRNSGIAGRVVASGNPLLVNDVSQNNHFSRFTDEVTGHVTKSIICVPLVARDRIIGVVEVVNKVGDGFRDDDLHTLAAIASSVAQIIDGVMRTKSDLVTHKIATNALLSTLNARETSMREHAKRVAEYTLVGATPLALSRGGEQMLEYAAILHDVGKLCLATSVPTGPESLTGEQKAIALKHHILGFNLLRGIVSLQEVSKVVLYHHERYDGSGQPKGLKADAIPIAARLIAVADAFDNLTTGRSGHAALGTKDALSELQRYAGSAFDPAAVKALSSGLGGCL